MASNSPFVPAVYFDGAGKILAGGRLVFFARGTNVPQTVYADLDGTVPLNGPDGSVTLDGAGHKTIFLGSKAYTVWAYNAAGVQQFEPIDVQGGGVGAGGFGTGSNTETVGLGNGLVVNLYADLEGLTGLYDVVYVAGRTSKGDGGQGWFARIPGSLASPDNGITLRAGSNVYTRIFSGSIDPRWYGVVYGSNADQGAAVLDAQTASARYGLPVEYRGQVFLNADRTVPTASSMHCAMGGSFVAPVPVGLTFAEGSRFSADGVAFGQSVQPKFPRGVVDEIRLSWMGEGTGDARVAKLVASMASGNPGPMPMVVDAAVDVSANIAFPQGSVLRWDASGRLTVTSPIQFSAPDVEDSGSTPVLVFGSLANALAVRFGRGPARPEWFGAVGDGDANDSAAIKAAALHGDVYLSAKYACTQAITVANPVTLRGDQVAGAPSYEISTLYLADAFSIGSNPLRLDGVRVYGTISGVKITCQGFAMARAGLTFGQTNTPAGFVVNSGRVDISDSSCEINDQIQGTGGVVRRTSFQGNGFFPLSLVDELEDCTFVGFAGHASDSQMITTRMERCVVYHLDTPGTLNLGQFARVLDVNLSSTASNPWWHFKAVQASSGLQFVRVASMGHLVKLNGTSTATVDAFERDVANYDGDPSTMAPSQGVLLSNGTGTVHLQTQPREVGQLWDSVGGVKTDRVRYSNLNGLMTGTNQLQLWKTALGTTVSTDGTFLSISSDTGGTTGTATMVASIHGSNGADGRMEKSLKLAALPLLGGILQMTVQTPAAAAPGCFVRLLADLSGASLSPDGGSPPWYNVTAWGPSSACKGVYIPPTSGAETIIVRIPVMGGYWSPSLQIANWGAQWFGLTAQLSLALSGAGTLGDYKIKLEALHDLPASPRQIPLWSDTLRRPIAGQLPRTVDFVVCDGFAKQILLRSRIPWDRMMAAYTAVRLPGAISSFYPGCNWYGHSDFKIMVDPALPMGYAGRGTARRWFSATDTEFPAGTPATTNRFVYLENITDQWAVPA